MAGWRSGGRHLLSKLAVGFIPAGYKVPKEVFLVEEVFRGPNGKADYKLSKKLATQLSAARAAG